MVIFTMLIQEDYEFIGVICNLSVTSGLHDCS